MDRFRKNLRYGSILKGCAKKKAIRESGWLFSTMCSAPAERDAHFVRDVSFGNDVRYAREDAEHITSLCTAGAIHHYGEAITSLRLAATSLFTNDQNYAII